MSAEKELNLPINPFLIFVLKIEKIIDKSKIIVEAGDNPDFYKIRYKEGKKNSKIMFQIDHARIPFGIDEEYKQYYITIEINDNEYIEYIKNIEENIIFWFLRQTESDERT